MSTGATVVRAVRPAGRPLLDDAGDRGAEFRSVCGRGRHDPSGRGPVTSLSQVDPH